MKYITKAEAERDAYKWAYEYLQHRMESIGRDGWAHDCDGEIEWRISQAKDVTLDPVEGNVLPDVGTKVLIHLASQDEWVEHEVVGYYVWNSHEKLDHLHRVSVRVRDKNGYLNARLLKDIRPVPTKG